MDDQALDGAPPGTGLVNADFVGTGLLVGTSVAAAIAPATFERFHAVLSCLLFAIGTGALLWAYALGITRSRTDQVTLTGLFFLGAGAAPPEIRRPLRIALAVQIVAVVAAASIRPYTEVAFGVLAPMFGLGLMGAWGGRHGTFADRPAREAA